MAQPEVARQRRVVDDRLVAAGGDRAIRADHRPGRHQAREGRACIAAGRRRAGNLRGLRGAVRPAVAPEQADEHRDLIAELAADGLGEAGQVGVVVACPRDLQADIRARAEQAVQHAEDPAPVDLPLVPRVEADRHVVDGPERAPDRRRNAAGAGEIHAGQHIAAGPGGPCRPGERLGQLRSDQRLAAGEQQVIGMALPREGADEPHQHSGAWLFADRARVRRAVPAVKRAAAGQHREHARARRGAAGHELR
jgi:hypothetical protein